VLAHLTRSVRQRPTRPARTWRPTASATKQATTRSATTAASDELGDHDDQHHHREHDELATITATAAIGDQHRHRGGLGTPGVRWLLVQQLLDPAQRASQGLCIGHGPAHLESGFEFDNHRIRYGLQRFRCDALHTAALNVARWAVD
jgi:hypothetical protein